MSMATYDATIKPHLQNAQEYAYRLLREFERMPAKPNFDTETEDRLSDAELLTLRLLETIRAAKAEYASKPLEREAS